MTSAFRRLPCQLGRLASSRTIATSTSTSTYISTSLHATRGSQRVSTCRTSLPSTRLFSHSPRVRRDVSSERPQSSNPKGLNPDEQEVRVKEKQVQRPWLREDADKPPADHNPDANPNKKGEWLGRGQLDPPNSQSQVPSPQHIRLTDLAIRRQALDNSDTAPETHRPPSHQRRERQRKQHQGLRPRHLS